MKKRLRVYIFIILLLFIWLSQLQAERISPSSQMASTAIVKAGVDAIYPDPVKTPGDVLTTDTAIVCVPGYSTKVRNVPLSEKRQVYAAYNITYPQPQGSYEVDHFISLELGGSNDIKNLWPEPSSSKPGSHEKDKVENYLHDEACSGRLSLSEAQNLIITDWYAVYLKNSSYAVERYRHIINSW